MKLTDFALIFIGIFLPIVIIVYVNTSFVVKAEKQEMYYKNMMNSAVTDAVSAMKKIENNNTDIDYGYSGIVDKKVSINAKVAVDTFYNSLANNFNIQNNEMSIEKLKMYIPVIAIMDYDGIYIHSAEEDPDKNIVFVTKDKVKYTYSYVIVNEGTATEPKFEIISLEEIDDTNKDKIKYKLLNDYIYEVNFTMDDYVYLNIYGIKDGKIDVREGQDVAVVSKGFYLNDSLNNEELIYESEGKILSTKEETLKNDIIEKLTNQRKISIATIAMREISYAVNKHNTYARQTGIKYNFIFSVESDTTWYDTMDGIGMIAIIQGISLGNRYLNYKAYSASDLVSSIKYYVSKGILGKDVSYLNRNLYHISDECDIYKKYLNAIDETPLPRFYSSKLEAATQGFYPCPVCKP